MAHARIGHRYVRDAIGDLSDGGLFLRTKEAARVGAPVRVALVLPGANGPEYCTLVGRVLRVDPGGAGRGRGVAVQFELDQIAPADRNRLEEFLARAAANPP